MWLEGRRRVKSFAIATEQLDRVLSLASKVLNTRTAFFDAEGRELKAFNIKETSPFCRHLRGNASFDARCVQCDRDHIAEARESKTVLVYTCHAGLYEAVVPLHDQHAQFLGALVFGQMRPTASHPPHWCSSTQAKLYAQLQMSDGQRMRDMAHLLKYVAEYVIQNELVRRRNPNWVDALEKFVDANLTNKITLEDMSHAVHRSRSFLSHGFKAEFGSSPLRYVARRKLERARQMLRSGLTVGETAGALGYCDEFHFSKMFKKHFGEPPVRHKRRSG